MKNIDRVISEKLEALLDGKLIAQDKTEVERVLKGSVDLREYLVYLKGIKLMASLTSVRKAPDRLADRVMNRIMTPKPTTVFSGWMPAVAAGLACLLVGVFLGAQWTASKTDGERDLASALSASVTKGASASDNLLLSQNALSSGDMEKAKQYLLAAERSPDISQFNAKGLNIGTIQELLNQGDSIVLSEYLSSFTGINSLILQM